MVAPLAAAAGISAVGSLLGGIIGGNSAKKAAKAQQQTAAAQARNAEDNRDFQYSLNQPSIDGGLRAQNLFSGFLGAGTSSSPGVTDYSAYVAGNPDVAAEWQKVAGSGRFTSAEDFGKWHYDTYGRGEGRDVGAFTTGAVQGGDGAQASADALDAFRGSTGYKDLVKEGLGAVNANAYAGGMGRSGATFKALQDRGMSLADRSSSGWLANLNTLMNYGGQARGLVANVGTQTVGAVNDASQTAADATSDAANVAGSNWAATLKNIGLAASSAYGSSYGSAAAPTTPTSKFGYVNTSWA